VSIGSGSRCGVRIDDPSLAGEEARTWVRNGQLMVHKMIRLTDVAIEMPTGGWLILEPGDTFSIGEHTFEFRLMPERAPAPGTDEPAPGGPRDPASPAPGIRPSFNPMPMPSADASASHTPPSIFRDAGPDAAEGTGMTDEPTPLFRTPPRSDSPDLDEEQRAG
jgi:hypothetical protein